MAIFKKKEKDAYNALVEHNRRVLEEVLNGIKRSNN